MSTAGVAVVRLVALRLRVFNDDDLLRRRVLEFLRDRVHPNFHVRIRLALSTHENNRILVMLADMTDCSILSIGKKTI